MKGIKFTFDQKKQFRCLIAPKLSSPAFKPMPVPIPVNEKMGIKRTFTYEDNINYQIRMDRYFHKGKV